MISKRFVIADVFTDQRFGGNQLAVFTDGSGVDGGTMQSIAREMNYSETTFLLPPERGGDSRVRIFTPASELPFAGHPLVGSAFVLVAERMKEWSEPVTALTLETGVGPIHVETRIENDRPGRTTMTQPLPEVRSAYSKIEELAKALSLSASQIEQTRLPVEIIYNGIAVMIVPVVSREAIEAIKPDSGTLARISKDAGARTICVFSRETLLPTSTVHCRVFAPAEGVPEDPATGSANGPLGFYLVRHGLVEMNPTTRIVSEQGFEMKRPSLLYIDVDVEPGTKQVTGVRVGGDVVISGVGELFVD